MWSLNGLYEQALRNILNAWPGAALESGKYSVTVIDSDERVNASTSVKPDYVMVRADGIKLVLDAKYKKVLSAAVTIDEEPAPEEEQIQLALGKGQRVRVRRADIYQVVAYARHSGLETDRAVLLYPIALEPGDSYPKPLRLKEFDPKCHIVFFDVGPNADEHRADLYRVLNQL